MSRKMSRPCLIHVPREEAAHRTNVGCIAFLAANTPRRSTHSAAALRLVWSLRLAPSRPLLPLSSCAASPGFPPIASPRRPLTHSVARAGV